MNTKEQIEYNIKQIESFKTIHSALGEGKYKVYGFLHDIVTKDSFNICERFLVDKIENLELENNDLKYIFLGEDNDNH